MDVEKQREIIRLWNDMRRVEGPVAEEIRIQILECFAQWESPSTRMNDRRAVASGFQPARCIGWATGIPARRIDPFASREVDSVCVKI